MVVNDTAVLFFYTDNLLVVNGKPYEDGSVDDKIVRLDEDNVDDKSGRPEVDNLLVVNSKSQLAIARIIMGSAQPALLFLAPLTTLHDVSSASLPSDISRSSHISNST